MSLTAPFGPEPAGQSLGEAWAIVLAGGEGTRLRPLTRQICRDDRPKQYVPLLGRRSLLRETLDRVELAFSPARTVVVTVRNQNHFVVRELTGSHAPHVLAQPEDRGTAAGVLFAAQWLSWRDPEATVAVFPSDHFVLEERVFMKHVLEVAAFVERHPEWLVLLGAQPGEPEVEYGWIEPGDPLGWSTAGLISRVRRFWEKPSAEQARACFVGGCLWDTLVCVARVGTFLEAGRHLLPHLCDRLGRIAPFAGTDDERWAVQQAYSLMPRANFSRSILEPCPAFLAVSKLPPVTWSDLGTPRRVLDVLRKARIAPPWTAALELSA